MKEIVLRAFRARFSDLDFCRFSFFDFAPRKRLLSLSTRLGLGDNSARASALLVVTVPLIGCEGSVVSDESFFVSLFFGELISVTSITCCNCSPRATRVV